MMINGLWNRRCGPGGGTRRLHQGAREDENQPKHLWGRNRIDVRSKDISFIRHGTVVIGLNKISATLVRTREENVAKAKATVTALVGSVKTVSAKTLINQLNVFAPANATLVAQAA